MSVRYRRAEECNARAARNYSAALQWCGIWRHPQVRVIWKAAIRQHKVVQCQTSKHQTIHSNWTYVLPSISTLTFCCPSIICAEAALVPTLIRILQQSSTIGFIVTWPCHSASTRHELQLLRVHHLPTLNLSA